jgi:hypothetical protein
MTRRQSQDIQISSRGKNCHVSPINTQEVHEAWQMTPMVLACVSADPDGCGAKMVPHPPGQQQCPVSMLGSSP